MVYDFPYSGKSLDECVQLLRDDSVSGSYAVETVAYALESLRGSPEQMRQYFTALTGIVGEVLAGELDRGTDLNLPAKIVASGTVPLEDVARRTARSQLVHVLGFYLGSEVPKEWNDAIPELEIPEQFLR